MLQDIVCNQKKQIYFKKQSMKFYLNIYGHTVTVKDKRYDISISMEAEGYKVIIKDYETNKVIASGIHLKTGKYMPITPYESDTKELVREVIRAFKIDIQDSINMVYNSLDAVQYNETGENL